jgi:hypothetical protein
MGQMSKGDVRYHQGQDHEDLDAVYGKDARSRHGGGSRHGVVFLVSGDQVRVRSGAGG